MRVPIGVIDNDLGGSGKVDAHSTRFGTDQKDIYFTVFAETTDSTVPVGCSNSSVKHLAAIANILKKLNEQLEHYNELGEDESLLLELFESFE